MCFKQRKHDWEKINLQITPSKVKWWYSSEDKNLMDEPGISDLHNIVDMLPSYLQKC